MHNTCKIKEAALSRAHLARMPFPQRFLQPCLRMVAAAKPAMKRFGQQPSVLMYSAFSNARGESARHASVCSLQQSEERCQHKTWRIHLQPIEQAFRWQEQAHGRFRTTASHLGSGMPLCISDGNTDSRRNSAPRCTLGASTDRCAAPTLAVANSSPVPSGFMRSTTACGIGAPGCPPRPSALCAISLFRCVANAAGPDLLKLQSA